MEAQRVGRNDPCPCRSGRKYKQCCLRSRLEGSFARPAVRGDGVYLRPPVYRQPPPKPKVRVGVEYTFADAFGTGTVSYAFERSQLFFLTDGQVVRADQVAAGMRFHLEDGMVATITHVRPPGPWEPAPPIRDPYGNTAKRVLGTVKYSGHYPILDLTVGDFKLTTTPGHRFYSLHSCGWVDAGSLMVGEHLLHPSGRAVRVNAVTAPRTEPIDLYNLEVEDFHTYFVGDDGNAVWSHNGLDGGCSVPKPAQRQRQVPESDGYWSSSPTKGGPKDGVPGESHWHSTDPIVTAHPEYRAVKFTDRYPDFSPITRTTVEIGVTGKPGFRDHFAASKALAKQLVAEPELAARLGIPREAFTKTNGKPNASKVYEWMKAQPDGGLTWHHLEDARTMAMVPWAIHEIPHAGGAAIARQAARNAAGH